MSAMWDIRVANQQEAAEALVMRNAAYADAPLSQAYWQWRYGCGFNPRILVAKQDQKIIGIQPVASFPLHIDGQLGSACMLTGVVTHPDFRRRGVFSSLVARSLEEARKSGDWLVYTFPNQYSFPGFMKAQWVDVGSLPLYLKPLELEAILEKRIANQWLRAALVAIGSSGIRLLEHGRLAEPRDVVVNHVESWDERIDKLWARICPQHGVAVRRDRAYLTWRYVEHPEEEYTIFQAEKKGALLGYIVVKAARLFGLKSGLIMDILALSPEVSDCLVGHALMCFKEAQMEVAGTLITDTRFYPRSLRRNGFLRCPIRLCPKEFYFVCQIVTPRAADAVSLKNWFLTWGDTDNV